MLWQLPVDMFAQTGKQQKKSISSWSPISKQAEEMGINPVSFKGFADHRKKWIEEYMEKARKKRQKGK